MKTPEQLAKEAIQNGKTMGQFLRELPDSKHMPADLLQVYAKAYHAARMAA